MLPCGIKEKVFLMLHLRQRAVILHPAAEQKFCGLYGRVLHPGQAGVHIQ